MYSTVKQEVDIRRGKKTHEQKCKECRDRKRVEKRLIKDEPQIANHELAEKVNTLILQEKKTKREYDVQYHHENHNHNHNQHLDDEDKERISSEIEMLSKSKNEKSNRGSNFGNTQPSIKFEETYPPDYDTYRKTIERKKMGEMNWTNDPMDDGVGVMRDSARNGSGKRVNYFSQGLKSFGKSLMRMYPPSKWEYTHPGTYVSIIFSYGNICFYKLFLYIILHTNLYRKRLFLKRKC